MEIFRGHRITQQRSRRSGADRNLPSARCGIANDAGIDRCLWAFHIAGHGRERKDVQLSRTKRGEQGDRIVQAWITIDNDVFHAFWSAARLSPWQALKRRLAPLNPSWRVIRLKGDMPWLSRRVS